jgi:anti-sigma factor RsiW
MTLEWDKGPPPTPEDLMAFADGELGPTRQEAVTEWLLGRPEAQGQIEEYRRLGQLWQSVRPPEPSPDAWAAALVRIEKELPPTTPLPSRWLRRPAWTFPALAAAAILGVVLLGRSLGPLVPSTTSTNPALQDDEPFPIALAHEINIVGMDAHDADSLVGHPPLSGSLEFAAPADVRLLNAQPHGDDGWVPRMGEGDVSLIVAAPP